MGDPITTFCLLAPAQRCNRQRSAKNKRKREKEKRKKGVKGEQEERRKNCRVSALCPARKVLTFCSTLKGCASHRCHCAKSNVQCTSMACGWCVAQTLLLTRVAKTTSTWRLSALPTAQEVSDQHFEKQFVLALRDPHLLW